jgi:hypothetical protein
MVGFVSAELMLTEVTHLDLTDIDWMSGVVTKVALDRRVTCQRPRVPWHAGSRRQSAAAHTTRGMQPRLRTQPLDGVLAVFGYYIYRD